MSITDVLGECVDKLGVCEVLGPPGKPLSKRTISRYENQPDGLPSIEVGGRKFYRIEAVREWLRRRERHRNPRRKSS